MDKTSYEYDFHDCVTELNDRDCQFCGSTEVPTVINYY